MRMRWITPALPACLEYVALCGSEFTALSVKKGAGCSSGEGYGMYVGVGYGAAHGGYENDFRNSVRDNEHTAGQGDGTFTDYALHALIDRLTK